MYKKNTTQILVYWQGLHPVILTSNCNDSVCIWLKNKCPSYDYSFGNLCPVKIHQRLMIGFNQNSEIRPYWYSWNLITAKTIAKPFFSNVEYLQLLSFSFRLKINTGSFNPLSWSNGIRTSPIPLSELSVLKIYKNIRLK